MMIIMVMVSVFNGYDNDRDKETTWQVSLSFLSFLLSTNTKVCHPALPSHADHHQPPTMDDDTTAQGQQGGSDYSSRTAAVATTLGHFLFCQVVNLNFVYY